MRLRHIPGAEQMIEDSPYVIQNPEERKGKWHEVFGNHNPIRIEVGMGKGRFIMELAKANPEINYIGIERYSTVLLKAIQKREQLAITNICFMCIDAKNMADIFDMGEVDRIYLNFSDPWPKARHAKRRLTSREFLARYSQILPDGAVVEFKTDNKGLFEFSLEEVNESEGWELLAHTFDLHHQEDMMEGNVMTEYEEKFSSMGNPICKLIAVLHE